MTIWTQFQDEPNILYIVHMIPILYPKMLFHLIIGFRIKIKSNWLNNTKELFASQIKTYPYRPLHTLVLLLKNQNWELKREEKRER